MTDTPNVGERFVGKDGYVWERWDLPAVPAHNDTPGSLLASRFAGIEGRLAALEAKLDRVLSILAADGEAPFSDAVQPPSAGDGRVHHEPGCASLKTRMAMHITRPCTCGASDEARQNALSEAYCKAFSDGVQPDGGSGMSPSDRPIANRSFSRELENAARVEPIPFVNPDSWRTPVDDPNGGRR